MRQLKFLVLLTAFLAPPAIAWSPQETHDAAHFGVSYVMNDFLFNAMGPTGLGCSKTEALVFSTVVSSLIGFIPEYFQAMQSRHLDTRPLMWNGLGNTAAVGTALMFKF